MENVIETTQIVKKYGKKAAVDHVNVHVKRGDIYGLIGKNGAGKTTLMRILLGLCDANEGEVKLFDSDKLPKERHRIGSIIEEPGLYYGKTAYGNMKAFSCVYDNVTKEDILALLKRVGLENTGRKKVRGFSLGMRQRLGLAIALMGKPDMLILDEPINGLDPAGIKEIRDMIQELNSQGVTFMISSHILDELGKIVTRYGIMADGALVEEISAQELKERCQKHIAVTVDDMTKAKNILLATFPDMKIKEAEEANTFNILSEVTDASKISEALVSGGVKLYSMHQQGTTFEDYFIERLGVAQ